MARSVYVASLALILPAVFVAPQLWLRATVPVIAPAEATSAEAALIFGAVVRQAEVTPLQRERLLAGKALYDAGKTPLLVVSNTPSAAEVMANYLTAEGLPREAISLDTQAERSPDTCAEAARRGLTDVIFISQAFHLPRLALHCRRYGLQPQFAAADRADRAPLPFWTTTRIRVTRFLREAAFTWATLLGLYPHQPAPPQ